MLHLITGLPGSGKSFLSVDLILKLRKNNERFEKANPEIYRKNTDIIESIKHQNIYLEDKLFVGDQKFYQDLRETFKDYIDADVTIEQIFTVLPDFSIFSGGFHIDHFKYTMLYNFFIAIINKQLNKQLKEINGIRQIYADISGLLIDDVERSPMDWRTTPDGSYIFYDEAQRHEIFRSKGRETVSSSQITASMAWHRHTGHDIYFITQDAKQLHKHILSLTGHHINISRPFGSRYPAVFEWSHHQPNPDSKTAQKRADVSRNFSLSKEIFKFYRSTTVDTHGFQWGNFLKKVALPVFAILFGIYFFFFTDNKLLNTHIASDYENMQNGVVPAQATTATGGSPQTGSQLSSAPAQQPANPMTDEYLIYLHEVERPAAIFDDGVNCRAFNTYGDYLHIDRTDCKFLSQNPMYIRNARMKSRYVEGSSISGTTAPAGLTSAPAATITTGT